MPIKAPCWIWLSVAALAIVVGVVWAARARQQRLYEHALADIEGRARRQARAVPTHQDLTDVPPPVLRYLHKALPDARRELRLARYGQVGEIRPDLKNGRWMPFTATQVIAPGNAEFLWSARVAIAPLVHLQVTDSLVRGTGAGKVALLSAVPIAAAGGGLEMNSGALHRFLAEAVWWPTALLPSASLQWTPLDDARAIATLTAGTTTVSLEFRFNAADEVIGIYTPGRWGRFDGEYRQVAWEGRFDDYRRIQGVLVPFKGEVGWHLEGKWQPVWRGAIVSASLEF